MLPPSPPPEEDNPPLPPDNRPRWWGDIAYQEAPANWRERIDRQRLPPSPPPEEDNGAGKKRKVGGKAKAKPKRKSGGKVKKTLGRLKYLL